MEYTRHTIDIRTQHGNIPEVLQAISSLQDQVVVNIAESEASKPVLLTEENLRAILAGAPESLSLETLPARDYKKLMREKIDQVAQSAVSLRGALRAEYVADAAAQVRDLLAQLEALRLLVGCYALQFARSRAAENVRTLQNLHAQLAASSFEYGDNVRCMDDLAHEIIPALQRLLRLFGK